MNVTEAVTSRRSVRQFLDKPVDQDVLRRVLEKAQRAPSGGNVQPWNAVVVTGQALDDLVTDIKATIPNAPMGEDMEYAIYPEGLGGRYEDSRKGVGEAMYQSINIPREDRGARIAQMQKNWDSFGAPVQMFTHTPKYMGPPQWSDLGMWLQTFMLLLREVGLDSCAQEIWALYGPRIKRNLDIPDDHILFCGMAIGYRDPDAPINTFDVPRVSIDDAIDFRGF